MLGEGGMLGDGYYIIPWEVDEIGLCALTENSITSKISETFITVKMVCVKVICIF